MQSRRCSRRLPCLGVLSLPSRQVGVSVAHAHVSCSSSHHSRFVLPLSEHTVEAPPSSEVVMWEASPSAYLVALERCRSRNVGNLIRKAQGRESPILNSPSASIIFQSKKCGCLEGSGTTGLSSHSAPIVALIFEFARIRYGQHRTSGVIAET
jgi:hypothetical protein